MEEEVKRESERGLGWCEQFRRETRTNETAAQPVPRSTIFFFSFVALDSA